MLPYGSLIHWQSTSYPEHAVLLSIQKQSYPSIDHNLDHYPSDDQIFHPTYLSFYSILSFYLLVSRGLSNFSFFIGCIIQFNPLTHISIRLSSVITSAVYSAVYSSNLLNHLSDEVYFIIHPSIPLFSYLFAYQFINLTIH